MAVAAAAAAAAAAEFASLQFGGVPITMNAKLREEDATGEPGDVRSDPLWRRIEAFSFDESDIAFPFSRRLARENGWSRYYAHRVVGEYRRFCYLMCKSPSPLTPSDAIDQAWHLHLIYSRNYWEDYCANTLRRPLHHHPTRGGESEAEKYADQYTRTLAVYRQTFQMAPPEDIWPTTTVRFANAQDFRRVDVAAYWLVPRPPWRFPWPFRIGFGR